MHIAELGPPSEREVASFIEAFSGPPWNERHHTPRSTFRYLSRFRDVGGCALGVSIDPDSAPNLYVHAQTFDTAEEVVELEFMGRDAFYRASQPWKVAVALGGRGKLVFGSNAHADRQAPKPESSLGRVAALGPIIQKLLTNPEVDRAALFTHPDSPVFQYVRGQELAREGFRAICSDFTVARGRTRLPLIVIRRAEGEYAFSPKERAQYGLGEQQPVRPIQHTTCYFVT